jgi:rhomboid protease GluP
MSDGTGTQPQQESGLTPTAEPSTFLVYNEATKENEVWTTTEVDQEKQFLQALAAAPKPVLTIGLIAINVAVFIAMVASGVSFMEPTVDSLLRWGADFGPLTTHGQWWRLLTAAFVHIGVIHLLMNMYILLSIGIFTERLFGRVGFLVLYLMAGIGGNLASLWWQPAIAAAGASGAVFGLYGGLLGYLLLQRHSIPARRVKALAKGAGIFLGYNVVYGMTAAHVDVAAHGGGFLTGLLLGCALATPLLADPAARLRRTLITAAAGGALAVVLAMQLPVLDDWRAEVNGFVPLEKKSLQLFNDALDKLKKNQESPTEFTQTVDKQILPAWNAERDRLSKLKLTKEQKKFAGLLVEYMSLRGEGWSLMAKGIAANDITIVQSANKRQAAADLVVGRINAAPKP